MPYLLRDRSKTKRNHAKYIIGGWVGWRYNGTDCLQLRRAKPDKLEPKQSMLHSSSKSDPLRFVVESKSAQTIAKLMLVRDIRNDPFAEMPECSSFFFYWPRWIL